MAQFNGWIFDRSVLVVLANFDLKDNNVVVFNRKLSRKKGKGPLKKGNDWQRKS